MLFYPKKYFKKIQNITIEFLQKNKIKALILDVDNTLINYKKEMPEEIQKWAKDLKGQGVKLYIVSNTNDKEKVIKNEEKLKYITYDEFKIFINTINDDFWKTFFNFVYFTGLRKGEIQALTWNDINFEKRTIYVTKTLTVKTKQSKWKITSTKNLKNRKIDMDNNLYDIMYTYFNKIKEEKNFNPSNFIFGNDEPLKQHKIDTNKDKYFKLSGVKRITLHQFRHSHVSFLINEYVKNGQTDTTKFFIITSARMGHTIKVMQDTYLHLFDDIQEEIEEEMNQQAIDEEDMAQEEVEEETSEEV